MSATLSIDDEWNQFIAGEFSDFPSNHRTLKKTEKAGGGHRSAVDSCLEKPISRLQISSGVAPATRDLPQLKNRDKNEMGEAATEKTHCESHGNRSEGGSEEGGEEAREEGGEAEDDTPEDTPCASELYISTKTVISYLTHPIDIHAVFWQIPVLNYTLPQNGVVKKQMKFNTTTREQLDEIIAKTSAYTTEHCVHVKVLAHVDRPEGRIKFKDSRKISIGISKKDILSYRIKSKSVFYNCFVMILRLRIDDVEGFREFHVKVFNTGKLEIPGVKSAALLHLILENVISTLQPYCRDTLSCKPDSDMTVLINSNFNCGYYINRDACYALLKQKYGVKAIYDPCSSYPGIQCRIARPQQDCSAVAAASLLPAELAGVASEVEKVSFMIFRTGSVLIAGKCDEHVIEAIYQFLTRVMREEFRAIRQRGSLDDASKGVLGKSKPKKPRRKQITVDAQYLLLPCVSSGAERIGTKRKHVDENSAGMGGGGDALGEVQDDMEDSEEEDSGSVKEGDSDTESSDCDVTIVL